MNKIKIAILVITLAAGTLFPQIRIKAVGDVMPGSVTPKNIVPSDSGRVFVDSLKRFFKSADITVGNFEGAFIEKGWTANKCSDTARALGHCYEFGIPTHLGKSLKSIGFNLLGNDNNHYEDYSIQGVKNTEKVITNLGIKYLGPKGTARFNINNQKVIVLPFSNNSESNSIPNIENAKKTVKAYKDSNYIVIVFFHGGKEGKEAQNIRDEDELFLGYNRGNVYKFARAVVDAGASLVIGHGPHVLRAMDIYKGKLIAYSLGNFLTHGNINIQGVSGVSVLLDVTLDEKTGDFVSGTLIPFRQRSPGIPYYDNSKEGIKVIQKLTKQDFPNSQLIITDSGELKFK